MKHGRAYKFKKECINTSEASNLGGKYILDLRNMFLNQENITSFLKTRKFSLTEKRFIVLSTRKFDLKIKSDLKTRTIFLKQELFLARK